MLLSDWMILTLFWGYLWFGCFDFIHRPGPILTAFLCFHHPPLLKDFSSVKAIALFLSPLLSSFNNCHSPSSSLVMGSPPRPALTVNEGAPKYTSPYNNTQILPQSCETPANASSPFCFHSYFTSPPSALLPPFSPLASLCFYTP